MKMKTKMKFRLLPVLLLAAVLALMLPHRAEAGGTSAGSSIVNKATINYQVNLIPQTLIESAPAGNTTPGLGNGANTTFVVDNKINVTVVATAGLVTTYPGSSAESLIFTVTNVGNYSQDFDLVALATDPDNQWAPGAITLYSDALHTLPITHIDALGIDAPYTVYVGVTVPVLAANGQWANVYLRAIAHADDAAGTLGALMAQTGDAVADTPGAVDVVFADADGDAGAIDAARDGAHMDWGAGNPPAGPGGPGGFLVSGAVLTVTKGSHVVSDPLIGVNDGTEGANWTDCTVCPKAIPTSTVEYTITIANGALAATATSVAITDTIDGNTAGVYNAYGAGPDGVAVNFNGGGALAGTSASDGVDGSGYDSSFVAGAISVSGISLAAGQNVVIKYQVTIN